MNKPPLTSSAHRPGLSRRRLILAAGAGGLGLTLAGSRRGWAAGAENVLKVGFVSPRTGALAGFGETDGYVLQSARKALAKGLTVGGKTYQVQILDRDTQSDPSRASQLAKDLINNDQVDLMLAVSTPEVINPVSDACELAGVPCLSTVMPWEAWYFGRGAKPGQPSPFKWTYHFGFGVEEFHKTYVSQWNGPVTTNKKVGVLYPNDADGNAIRAHLAPLLAKQGFTIVDPGPYEDGTTDYSAQIAKFKSAGIEILTAAPIPSDFIVFIRQAAQQGLARSLKICTPAKFGEFPSDIQALAGLGLGMTTGAYWCPVFPYASPVTGMNSLQLTDAYQSSTGKQWTQQLGATMSLIDAGFAALKNSGNPKNKAAVAKALGMLDVVTTIGRVNFPKGPVPNVATTPLIGAQWVKTKPGSRFPLDLVTIEHACDPHVPVQAKLLPYA